MKIGCKSTGALAILCLLAGFVAACESKIKPRTRDRAAAATETETAASTETVTGTATTTATSTSTGTASGTSASTGSGTSTGTGASTAPGIRVEGEARVGGTLQCVGVPSGHDKIFWQASADGTTYALIANASGASFVPTTSQAHKRLRCGYGLSQTVRFSEAVQLENQAPTAFSAAIAGTAAVGQTLSCDGASPSDPDGDARAHAIAWESSSDGTAYVAVATTTRALPVTAALAHRHLRCTVTATDGHGGERQATAAAVLVANTAPVVSAVATDGPKGLGALVTCSVTASDADGDPLAHSYEWERRLPPAAFAAIPGETSATYRLAIADAGREVRCRASTTDGAATTAPLASAAFAPATSLDPSFGAEGVARFRLGYGSGYANRIAPAAGGGYVVAGASYFFGGGSPDSPFLVKLGADGKRDVTFGTLDGTAWVGSAGTNMSVREVVTTATAYLVLAEGTIGGQTRAMLLRFSHAGILDTSFGTNGAWISPDAFGPTSLRRLLVEAGGAMTLAGCTNPATKNDVVLVRLTSAGALDGDWATGGVARFDVASVDQCAIGLEKENGSYYVGAALRDANWTFGLLKATGAGALDTTFGTSGVVTVALGAGNDTAQAMTRHGDGLVLAGKSVTGGVDEVALVRLTFVGALDGAFGAAGKVVTAYGVSHDVRSVVATGDDVVVIGSKAAAPTAFAARFDVAGDPVTAFGGDGTVALDFGAYASSTLAGATVDGGHLIAVGFAHATAGSAHHAAYIPAAARLALADGTRDLSFGEHADGLLGIGAGTLHSFAETPSRVRLDASGRYLLPAAVSWNGNYAMVVVGRMTATGAPDAAFGIRGVTGTSIPNYNSSLTDLAPMADGRRLAVGSNTTNLLLARFDATGALDATFGTSGVATRSTTAVAGNFTEALRNVVVESDASSWAAGYTTATDRDFLLARFTDAGAFDTSWATTGWVATDFGAGNDDAHALRLHGAGKALVVGEATTASGLDFAAAQYDADGDLDATFGAGGKVTVDFDGDDDGARCVLPLSGGAWLLAGKATVDGTTRMAAVKLTAAGVLDVTFGVGGVVTHALAATASLATDCVLDAAGRVLLIGEREVASRRAVTVARLLADGNLDTTFNQGLGYYTHLDGFNHQASSVLGASLTLSGLRRPGAALDADGRLVVRAQEEGGDAYVLRLYMND